MKLKMISSNELEKALQLVTKFLSQNSSQPIKVVEESVEDLLFYDNAAMLEKLKVSERTLQRYRKKGIISYTKYGGKVYYPKNFMVTSPKIPESDAAGTIPINEFVKRLHTPKPKSKIINLEALRKRISQFPLLHDEHRRSKIKMTRDLIKANRKKRYQPQKLWPKKIKLIGLPIKVTKVIPLIR